jgi:hypothetical protein
MLVHAGVIVWWFAQGSQYYIPSYWPCQKLAGYIIGGLYCLILEDDSIGDNNCKANATPDDNCVSPCSFTCLLQPSDFFPQCCASWFACCASWFAACGEEIEGMVFDIVLDAWVLCTPMNWRWNSMVATKVISTPFHLPLWLLFDVGGCRLGVVLDYLMFEE